MSSEEENNDNNEVELEVKKVSNIKNPDYSPKIVVIGDAQVGKTSIFKTLKEGQEAFPNEYQKSDGYMFFAIFVKTKEKSMKLNIWDTSSDESYRPALLDLCRNTFILLIAFSVTDENSFKNLQGWVDDAKPKLINDQPIYLIANKVDDKENRKISTEQIKEFVKKNGIMDFIEISAKENLESYNLLGFLANAVIKESEKGNEVRFIFIILLLLLQ